VNAILNWTPPILARLMGRVRRDYICGGYMGLEGLDRRLVEAIAPGRNGYFVELGAFDGVAQSNTYVLQRRFGWTGLLVEPSPVRFAECVRNRAFGNTPHVRCAACVPLGFRDAYVPLLEAGLMSVAQGLAVSDDKANRHATLGASLIPGKPKPYAYAAIAKTLTSILDEVAAPRMMDLLSLDVEGNERAVLEGIDFSKYSFRWMLVESRDDDGVGALLSQHGYKPVADLLTSAERRDVLYAALPTPI
jgi:FkbM family methyltransferase